ncbi:Calx-beta domain-containing protein [Gimesia aquarii]|uniref:Calx-beta domain protein n=1 Tax=Gimesia aquarii TaxID=2527964 RepID=A0A517WUW9_9PLAN|nr:Calx-beta domain-containing protein [Gimesia aquarii]QDU09046.1 Calx-beta domain protein [Gimesia aquarii]
MLISNWLSALVSTIQRRPRYNSRARRAIRKRWQAIQQNCLSTVDRLEERTLLTAQIIDGTSAADDFQLQMNADGVTLEVWNDTTLVFSDLLTNVTELSINGGAGADTFTVDLSNGLPFPTGNINFDGEADGGSITLDTAGYAGSLTTVTHTLNSDTSGSISIDGQIISYTNTASLTDNLDTTNRIFDFAGAAETVTLSDHGTTNDGYSSIDSTLGAAVTFANTSSAVTVLSNTGSGADTINVQGLDSLNASSLTITGDADDDVNFQTNSTVMGSNDLTVNAQTITVSSGISSTSGAVSLTASRNIALNTTSSLTTVDGGITLVANSGGTTTGTFIGIDANNATIQSTGSGNVAFTSISGDGDGIYLYGGTSVTSTATGVSAGTISLNGTGGGAASYQHGILLIDASISSVDGAISLTGQGGGDGTAINNNGLYLHDSSISSTGTGVNAATITLDGTAGNGISINRGIRTAQFSLTSVDGDISITGQGAGDVTGSSNEGIVFGAPNTITSTGTAAISIHGLAGAGLTYNQGISVSSQNDISSVNADIMMISDGDLLFSTNSDITATSGNLQVTANYLSASNTGNMTINGTAVLSTGSGNIDLDAAGDISLTSLVATGTVTVDSTSGSILDNDDTNIDIVAATAALTAAGSIGTVANPLTTQMDAHTAVSGTSDVNINNRELFSISDTTANEDGTFTFTVSINHATDQNVTVLASTAYGTAGASDLTAISNQLMTIAAGQTSTTVTVSVTNDNVLENDETFTVVLSDPKYNGATNAARIAIGDGTATGTILNEDSIKIIDDGDVGFSISGPDWVHYNWSGYYQNDAYYILDGGSAATGANTASWAFSDLPAGTYRLSTHWLQGVDRADNVPYSVSGIVGGTVNGTFDMITLNADVTDDGVGWEDLGYFEVAQDGTLTVSISDNLVNGTIYASAMRLEKVKSTLSINDVSISEDAGTATFTVTLSEAVLGGVSVDWSTANGTATAGADYTAGSGTLNFTGTAGESQTITITLNDDFIAESDETFLVNLSNVVASETVGLVDPSGTGTIIDDDRVTIDGSAAADNFQLQMNADGLTLEVLNNSTLVYSGLLAEIAELNINGGAGADTFTVDLSNGLPFPTGNINFDGETDGGTLVLDTAGYTGSLTTVTHTLNSDTSGSISIDGQIINYTNTASLTDDLATTNRIFDFAGAAETVTLSDHGTSNDGFSNIDSTLGAAVTFANTSSAVTVLTNSGNGADTINVQGLDSLNASSLTITGDADDDVNFQTNSTVMGANDLTVNAQTITVSSGISSTSGAVSLTASRNIALTTTSSLTTVDGGITLLANDGGLTTGDFIGIDADNATIQSTGTGNISLTGFGGNSDDDYGIYLKSSNLLSTSTNVNAGTITLNGTGGTGTASNLGIFLNTNSIISSVMGGIQLTGQGTDGTGAGNVGVMVFNGSEISSTGTGINAATISIDGTGGASNFLGHGVKFHSNAASEPAKVTSIDGNISITGQGYNGAGTNHFGVELINTVISSLGTGINAATVTINGTGGNAAGERNYGVTLWSTTLTHDLITSVDGNIIVTGQGGAGAGGNHFGVLTTNGKISSTGTGVDAATITINGDGGTGGATNYGTFLFATDVKSQSGDITIIVEDDVVLGGNRSINTSSGDVTVTADNSVGNNGGFLFIYDDTWINAGTGNIDLNADGDIHLTSLISSGTVTVDSTSGSILDNGDERSDIFATTAILNALNSVGTVGNPLEANVVNLSGTGTNGGFHVNNSVYKRIIDDGDTGFSISPSGWTYLTQNIYYSDDSYYMSSGANPGVTASWEFTDLIAGTYRISGQWYADANRATNTEVTVSGIVGGNVVQTIDQQSLRADVTDNGFDWQDLGFFTVDAIGSITVTMANELADGYVIADAMRLEKVDSALSISDVSINEDEGTATFTVTSSLATGSAFSVDFATADGTATAGSDYTTTNGTLNFVGTAGETQTITVELSDDNTVELDENFFVNLSNVQATGLNIALTDSQATGTIFNNDTTVISLQNTNVSQLEGDGGTTQFDFVVNISNPLDIDFHFWSRAIDNTATEADGDFTDPHIGNWSTITAGATSTTVSYSVNGDTKIEADEIFSYAFPNTFYSSISPQTTLSTAYSNNISFEGGVTTLWGIGTIINEDYLKIIDDGDVGFSIDPSDWVYHSATGPYYYSEDSYYVAPGANPGVTASWEFDNLPAGTYRISGFWQTDPSRATNAQYTVSGIEGGSVTQTINQQNLTADVNDSGFDWQDLGFFTVDANGTINVTVSNDLADGHVMADAMRLEKVDGILSINDISIDEDAGTATFTVTSSLATGTAFSVDYTTADGTATAGSDYTATNGTLNFVGTAGETQTVTVVINNDPTQESDENFLVNLSNVQAGGLNVVLANSQGIGTIVNEDYLKIIDDGDTGFSIDPSDWVYHSATGPYYYSEDSYYVAPGANPGVTASWEFDNLPAGTYRISGFWQTDPSRATNAQYTVSGIEGGSVTQTINQQNLTADVNDSGFDWQDLGFFTVDANGTINVTVSNDLADGHVMADAMRLEKVDGILSINDISIDEDAGTATFTVTSSLATGTAFSVDYTTADGTATAGSDYTATNGTLNFVGTAGETQTVTVVINNDPTQESDENFLVNLSNVQAGGLNVVLADSQGIGTIVNEDYLKIIDDGDTGFSISPSGWTYLTQNIYYSDDTYYMSPGANPGVTANWEFTDLIAGTYRISGQWYADASRATNTEVTVSGIVGGDVVQTIDQQSLRADVTDNGFDWQDLGFFTVDANGSITVTMANELADGYVIADAMRLEKVDSALSISDVSINEDEGTATFTVTSSLATGSAFSVDFSTADGTATAGSDYTATNGTLNFVGTAGETQTVTVVINNDPTQESDENFLVNLSNVQAGGLNVVLADSQGIGTIVNEDYLKIIDDGDTGFSISPSGWTYLTQNIYYSDDTYYMSPGANPGVTASWEFTDLIAGTYRISGQWYADASRATNTEVTVSGIVGGDVVQTIDQQSLRADVTDNGFDWQDLGFFKIDTNGSITVTMANELADGYVIADAMRIEKVNSIPVAINESIAATEDGTTVTTSILASDLDTEDDPNSLTYNFITLPTEGSVTSNNDGTFTFDPETDFQDLATGETRQVTFSYTATDSHSAVSNTGIVTVTVTGVNDVPTVSALNTTTTEDDVSFSLDLLTGANDLDTTDILGVNGLTLVSGDASGITDNGTSLGIDPNAYTGLAAGEIEVITYTYNVTDGNGGSVPQTATITITGVNDVPTVSALNTEATEDDVSFSLDLLTGANDVDTTDILSMNGLTLVSGDASGITDNGTSLGIDPSAYQSLAVNESEVIVYHYNVIDNNGGSVVQTATITITGVNDAPAVGVAVNSEFTEDDVSFSLDLLTGANDLDTTDILGVNGLTLVSGDASGITDNGTSLGIDPNAYTGLAAGEIEIITYTYNVTDGNGGSVPQTVTITITGVNDVPTVSALNTAATEDDVSFSLDLLTGANDVDTTDILGVNGLTLVSGDASGITDNGTSLGIDPSAYQSLAANESEVIVYHYNVIDNNGGSVAQTATITITGVNDAPTVGVAVNSEFTEDAVSFSLDLLTGANDLDTTDILGVNGLTLVSGDASGITDNGTSLGIDPSAYTGLAAGEIEVITYTYNVTDGNGGSVPQTVTITITGVNDVPTVSALNTAATEDDVSFSLDLLTGANDLDTTDILGVNGLTLVSGDASGITDNGTSLGIDPNAYTGLAADEIEVITYTYNVTDGNGGSVPQTATITITGVNDAPIAIDDFFETDETTVLSTENVLNANPTTIDSDAEGQVLTVIAVDGGTIGTQFSLSSGALLTLNSTGNFSYDPNGQFDSLAAGETTIDTFDYTIDDGDGGTDMATATITITGSNATLSISDTTVNETDGTVGITLTLDKAVVEGFSVDWSTSDDTAIDGIDYISAIGTLNFAGNAGETQTITINLLQDSTVEITEQFFIHLDNALTASPHVSIPDDLGIATITEINQPPQVASLGLANDTGIQGDLITSNALITGVLTDSDQSNSTYEIQVDTDDDGIANLSFNNESEFFEADLQSYLTNGSVTIQVRIGEWDTQSASNIYGDWTSFTFTYNSTPAAGTPLISGLSLENDTDVDGDLITSDASISGMITDDGTNDEYFLHIDLDNDGFSDISVQQGPNQQFTYDLGDDIEAGEHTIQVRALGFITGDDGYIFGDWSTITFTYNPVTDVAIPVITGLSLENDTDIDGDLITSDATIKGMITDDGTNSEYTLQIDLDNDGFSDFSVAQGSNQQFTYDLGNDLEAGEHTIQVRALGLNSTENEYISGEWSTITFTYNPPLVVNAVIDSLELDTDSGTNDDQITVYSSFTGEVTTTEDFSNFTVQLDFENDGIVDSTTTLDLTGQFTVDPSASISSGNVTVAARLVDNTTGAIGDWTTLSFELITLPAYTLSDESVSISQDTVSDIDILTNASYRDHVSVAITSAPVNGTITTLTNEDLTRTFSYTPDENYTGTDTFTYSVTDILGNTTTATVTLTMFANAAPTAEDDTIETYETEPVTINVLTNDSDIDTDTFTLISVDEPLFGTIEVNPAGSDPGTIIYTPNTNFVGNESLKYTIEDEHGRTTTATLTISVVDRPAPELTGLALYNDTEFSNDLLTEDARVTGQVSSTRGVEFVRIQFDFDGDLEFDQTTDLNIAAINEFRYDVGLDVPYGDVSLYARAVEVDENGNVIETGDWNYLSFVYVENHDPLVDPEEIDPNADLVTNFVADIVTTALVRLTGQAANTNGGDEPVVEFDLNQDNEVDATTTVTAGAFSQDFTTEIGYGEITILARTKDWDTVNLEFIYSDWTELTITRDAPVNAVPVITQVGLVEDTDIDGDGITSNSSLTGTVTNSDGTANNLIVEYDLDGDQVLDGFVYTAATGTASFTMDFLSDQIPEGENTISVRAREWDANIEDYVYSTWSSVTFTYEPIVEILPGFDTIALVNDTDTPDDKITTDPRISAIVVGDLSDYEEKAVLFDIDQDGIADGRIDSIDAVTGEAIIDLTDYVNGSGEYVVSLQVWGWDDDTTSGYVGEWSDFTFTYEASVPGPPQVTNLELANDTDTPADNITSDPTLIGTVSYYDTDLLDGMLIEYDLDGDGLFDGSAVTTEGENGNFELDLSGHDLESGSLTIAVRAGVWDLGLLDFEYGDWSSITFTYEDPNGIDELPQVTSLALVNDTGTPGDGITSSTFISGVVTDADTDLSAIPIEFDVNGDGIAEGTTYTDVTGSGEFLFDAGPYLNGETTYTVQVRAAQWSDSKAEYDFGSWASLTFTYETEVLEELDGSEDSGQVDQGPFTPAEQAHAKFYTDSLEQPFTAETESSENAGVYRPEYDEAGDLIIDASFLVTIGVVNTNDSTPFTDTDTTTDVDGNITEVITDTLTTVVVVGTESVDGEWYWRKIVTTTYTIETNYTAIDGSGYELEQTGTYGYTIEAYGYNGNATYQVHEYRTDEFRNDQWTAAAPLTIYTNVGSQGYQTDGSGYKKANQDDLIKSGSTFVETQLIAESLFTTGNLAAPVVSDVDYTNADIGTQTTSSFTVSGSTGVGIDVVDPETDIVDDGQWSRDNSVSSVTDSNGDTTTTTTFGYSNSIITPISESVSTNTTTQNSATTSTTINHSSSLTGTKTETYSTSGSRTTYDDGTYSSSVSQSTTTNINDTYTLSYTKTVNLTDNTTPGDSITSTSTSTNNINRTRNYTYTVSTLTNRDTAGNTSVSGTISGASSTNYTSSNTSNSNSSGTSAQGDVTLSFMTNASSMASESGSQTINLSGTFSSGYANASTTKTIYEYSQGSTNSSNSASSSRSTPTTTGKSSSSNSSNSTYDSRINVTESTVGGVTSTNGSVYSQSLGGGINKHDHTVTTNIVTPTSSSSSFSYDNGSSTFSTRSSANGSIINGVLDITISTSYKVPLGEGKFARGGNSSFSSNVTDNSTANRTITTFSSGSTSNSTTGKFNIDNTTNTHTVGGNSTTTGTNSYDEQGKTKSSSSSSSLVTVVDTTSAGTTSNFSQNNSSSSSGKGQYSSSVSSNTGNGGTTSTTNHFESSGSGNSSTSSVTSTLSVTGSLQNGDGSSYQGTVDQSTVEDMINGTGSLQGSGHDSGNGVSSFALSTSTQTIQTSSFSKYDNESTITDGAGTFRDDNSLNTTTLTQSSAASTSTSSSSPQTGLTKSSTSSRTNSSASLLMEYSSSNGSGTYYADGSVASLTTSKYDSVENFTSNESSDSSQLVNLTDVNGVSGHRSSIKSSSVETTGLAEEHVSSSDQKFADGTSALQTGASGKSAITSVTNSSDHSEANTTDTSKANLTLTVVSHNYSDVTDNTKSINSAHQSSRGILGNTSWSTETYTASGQTSFDNSSVLTATKDANNYEQKTTTSEGMGTTSEGGSSSSESFADGTSTANSSYYSNTNGTSESTDIKIQNAKVTNTSNGITTQGTSHVHDEYNTNNVVTGSSLTINSSTPVNGIETVTVFSSSWSSGEDDWDYSSVSDSSQSGTATSPTDPNASTTINSSKSHKSLTRNGGGTFNESSSSTTTTQGTTSTTSSSSSSSSSYENKTVQDDNSNSKTTTLTSQGTKNIKIINSNNNKNYSEIKENMTTYSQSDTDINGNTTSSTGTTGKDPSSTDETSEDIGNGGTIIFSGPVAEISGFSKWSSTDNSRTEIDGALSIIEKTTEVVGSSNFKALVSTQTDTDSAGNTTDSGTAFSKSHKNEKTTVTQESETKQKKAQWSQSNKAFLDRVEKRKSVDMDHDITDGFAVLEFDTNGNEVWSGQKTSDTTDYHEKYKKTSLNTPNTDPYEEDTNGNGVNEKHTISVSTSTEEKSKETIKNKTSSTLNSNGEYASPEDQSYNGDPSTVTYKHEASSISTVKNTHKWEEEVDSGNLITKTIVITTNTVPSAGHTYKHEIYDSGEFDKIEKTTTSGSESTNSTFIEKTVKSSGRVDTETTTSSSKSSHKDVRTTKGVSNGSGGNTVTTSIKFEHVSETKSGLEIDIVVPEVTSSYPIDINKDGSIVTGTYEEKYSGYDYFSKETTNTTKNEQSWDEATQTVNGTNTKKSNTKLESATERTNTTDIVAPGMSFSASEVYTAERKSTYDATATQTYSIAPGDVLSTSSITGTATVNIYGSYFDEGHTTGDSYYLEMDYTDPENPVSVQVPVSAYSYGTTTVEVSFTGSYDVVSESLQNLGTPTSTIKDISTDFDEEYAYLIPNYYTYNTGAAFFEGSYNTLSHSHPIWISNTYDFDTLETTGMGGYSTFAEIEALNPSFLDGLLAGLNESFTSALLPPGLAGILALSGVSAEEFLTQLANDYEDGSLFDRGLGAIDGFLDTINPFDSLLSIPDIGPLYGNLDDYQSGYTVGAVAGVVTSIAVGAFGPGLVQCGSLAQKALIAYEVADIAGGLATAGQSISNGNFGMSDVLAIGGAALSAGGLKKAFSQCFTEDMCFAEGPVEVIDAGWSTELTTKELPGSKEEDLGFVWFIVGMTITGFGVMQVRRLRRKSLFDFQPAHANPHDLIFSDHKALDDILYQPKESGNPKQDAFFSIHQPARENTGLASPYSMIKAKQADHQPETTFNTNPTLKKAENKLKPKARKAKPMSFLMRLFAILLCFSIGGFCLFQSDSKQPAIASIAQNEQAATQNIPPLKPSEYKLKSVADYQVGDTIMAFNHETGQREQKTVTQTFKRQVDHLRILEVEGEDGTTQTIKTTNEHPFWSSAANEYVEAKHLKPGTKLQGANGHFITVKSTRYEPHPEGITVYNVEVKGPHNYFVAENGYRGPPVLAHNTCEPKPFAIGVKEHLDDFTKRNNATNYKSFADPDDWKAGIKDRFSDKNQKILVNLQGPGGVEINAWDSVTKVASNRGTHTDWEIFQIYSNPEMWGRVEWFVGLIKRSNPFE